MSEKSSIKPPKKEELIDMVKSRGFDSVEEFEFGEWLREACELGVASLATHHPAAIKLSDRFSIMAEKKLKTKTVMAEKFLLHPHEYTPDYRVVFNEGMLARIGLAKNTIIASPQDQADFDFSVGLYYIDVKGGFSRFHDGKSFSINQKWVYDKYKIFINKIVPEDWFVKTWVPEFCKTTWKKGEIRDKWRGNLDKAAIKERLKI